MMDLVLPPRPVSLSLVTGRGHYDAVVRPVRDARCSVWVATANLKELMVERGDGGEDAGTYRGRGRRAFHSVLEDLDALARRGVELRVLHARLPSRAFREAFDRHPRLVAGGLELRQCPRVHLKTVIVDGERLYLGSANWTGAGLGARGSAKRNFEAGIITADPGLLDRVQELFDRIWRGAECAACALRQTCEAPLDL